jgi:DNA mismatch endonuclease, patch repair protein
MRDCKRQSMADTVTPAVRSRMMAGIKGRDTKPEMILRRGLHGKGFRFRLHTSHLPGKPDMVFPKHRAVIFANGCFWHGHDCPLFKWPSTRQDFWKAKITGNRDRDGRVKASLLAAGWRVMTVWECALKVRRGNAVEEVIARCSKWLMSSRKSAEIRA